MGKNVAEEEIINEVYNLIVDSKITDNERNAFIKFKNKVGEKGTFSEALMSLSYDLREIAIKNVSKKRGLTPNVGKFYKEISTYGQLELNWARGLASYGMIF